MKIQLTLNPEKSALLTRLMEGSYMTRAAFIVHLMAQEEKRRKDDANRRQPGRPRKQEDDENELPDENAPKTLKLPDDLKEYVLFHQRKDLVNEYDIEMLREKKRMHLNA